MIIRGELRRILQQHQHREPGDRVIILTEEEIQDWCNFPDCHGPRLRLMTCEKGIFFKLPEPEFKKWEGEINDNC